jgi:hypothetical protein
MDNDKMTIMLLMIVIVVLLFLCLSYIQQYNALVDAFNICKEENSAVGWFLWKNLT